jgi:hypothetical protein
LVLQVKPGSLPIRCAITRTLSYEVNAETAEVTRWILLPKGQGYRNFRIVRYKTEKPDQVERVRVVTQYLAEDYTILAYKLLSVCCL